MKRTQMRIDRVGTWRLYWGPGPLPGGARAVGTVCRGGEHIGGALIQLNTGIYVQGNIGGLRMLPQAAVCRALA